MPFDESKALRVKTFIENLTFSKGDWKDKPFRLIPWQWEELIRPAFGTLREDGNRQIRFVYVEIPKKNGKTELGAAIALYMLCADREGKPEVYSAAGDKEQAGLVYQAAEEMAKNNPELLKHLRIIEHRKRIVNRKNSGFYQVLSSESELQHGLSPSCVIFDELHAQPNDRLWNVLTSGTDYARRQQLIIVLTTAGVYDKNSIWWKIRAKAIQISKGISSQPNFLPVLYIADPEKDKDDDEELWKRVNPSLGYIFNLQKIRDDYEIARKDPVEFQNFRRFRLNIPIRQLSKWMPMDKWDACASSVPIESLKGRKAYGGLDLSSTTDLTALVFVFPPTEEDGYFDVIWKFYCPEEGIVKRSQYVNYDIWQKKGFLTATPGNVVDYEFVENDIFEAAKIYDLKQIGYDPWNAMATATRVMGKLNPTNYDHGFQMVEVRQGAKTFNEPAKDLLVKIMTGKVRHGDDPVARWNADNLVMRTDANANIAPDKEHATEKIDGMVALLMAWSRAMLRNAPHGAGLTILGPKTQEEGAEKVNNGEKTKDSPPQKKEVEVGPEGPKIFCPREEKKTGSFFVNGVEFCNICGRPRNLVKK